MKEEMINFLSPIIMELMIFIWLKFSLLQVIKPIITITESVNLISKKLFMNNLLVSQLLCYKQFAQMENSEINELKDY